MTKLNIVLALVLVTAIGYAINARNGYQSAQTRLDETIGALSLVENSITDPISNKEAHKQAAAAWFERNGIDPAAVSALPADSRARLVNFLTYRFCRNGNETPADLNELFKSCSTPCGGFAYVFRGLASVAGLSTRYGNLYNIPNQGNHVGVEVQVEDGSWSFYDPTFGAYFSETGDIQGRALGLHEITKSRSLDELSQQVMQADRTLDLSIEHSLASIYSKPFEHQYMSVANYRYPEAITMGTPDELLMLRIPLKANADTLGKLDSSERQELKVAWLGYTNDTLNDDNGLNDTSYAAHMLYNGEMQRATLLVIEDTIPGGDYELKLRLFNPRTVEQTIQINGIGKETQLESYPLQQIPVGASLFKVRFNAASNPAQILVRAANRQSYVEMLAMEVTDHVPSTETANQSGSD